MISTVSPLCFVPCGVSSQWVDELSEFFICRDKLCMKVDADETRKTNFGFKEVHFEVTYRFSLKVETNVLMICVSKETSETLQLTPSEPP